MAKKLKTYVHVVEKNDKGDLTNQGTFGPDDDLPGWAEKSITNPDVWEGEDGPEPATEPAPQPSPRRTK